MLIPIHLNETVPVSPWAPQLSHLALGAHGTVTLDLCLDAWPVKLLDQAKQGLVSGLVAS